jgi:hypothetical protein
MDGKVCTPDPAVRTPAAARRARASLATVDRVCCLEAGALETSRLGVHEDYRDLVHGLDQYMVYMHEMLRLPEFMGPKRMFRFEGITSLGMLRPFDARPPAVPMPCDLFLPRAT